VRRALIERGLLLMLSRSFVSRRVSAVGIEYQASESAAPFLAMLQSEYILLLRVYSKEMSDFVTDGKPRGSRGKGLRAISHAAVTLGLLEYCQERSLPHPGFVVMDSPLLACFKPEGEEDQMLQGSDLKERFYEYLIAHHGSDGQVIVIENQHPPADVEARVHMTVFTRNPAEGRFGLL
jgi:hypothetical protein